MESTPLIDCIADGDVEALATALRSAGYRVVRLDGSTIEGEVSFRGAFSREVLGWDRSARGWDELADGLDNYLHDLEDQQVALLWTQVHNMLDGGLLDLLTAVDVLVAVARAHYSSGRVVLIRLLGIGPNFATGHDTPP